MIRPKKKKLFVSCNGPKKNRVGRSVKNLFLHWFFLSKMCVLSGMFMYKNSLVVCMFYIDWELGRRKKL